MCWEMVNSGERNGFAVKAAWALAGVTFVSALVHRTRDISTKILIEADKKTCEILKMLFVTISHYLLFINVFF